MKNKMIDLNNALFAQLERLGEEDLIYDEQKLGNEIHRTKAIASIAEKIIDNADTMIKAVKTKDGLIDANLVLPKILEDKNNA